MTDLELIAANAIAPGRVTYVPGTATKRFARNMSELAQRAPDTPLTPRQHRYLLDTVFHFRRQIPREISSAIIAARAIERAATEPREER